MKKHIPRKLSCSVFDQETSSSLQPICGLKLTVTWVTKNYIYAIYMI